ncbi:MAG: YbgC/FadM family acyl-CoA thioesterase [Dehalococcoidia bacterium]|nr:YbgC/FadM family acyl-CoA thioesterase [Dehalococcoidia bacterium]
MLTKTEIKVRGYHLDVYQHVNNARYLEFLEEGRWVFLEQNRSSDQWHHGLDFVVANININYRRPAKLGDVLEIRTDISTVRAKSGVIHQEIVFRGTESLVADADVTFAILDSKTKQALPLKESLYTFFDKLAESKDIAEK